MPEKNRRPSDAATTHDAGRRRDRAIRLRRRVTTTVAATGIGTVAAFGVLAASHNPGTTAVATSTGSTTASVSGSASMPSPTPAPASSASASAAAATPAPTVAPATAAPTAVTGGSGH